VDGGGKPLARFRPMLDVVLTPGCHRYDMDALQRGELAADSEFVANIDRRNFWGGPYTDAEGRCTFDPLIPGATYRINGYVKGRHAAGRDFTVRPGEMLELPAVTIDRRE